MKKLLLSLAGSIILSAGAFAQTATNSDLSHDAATVFNTGYTFQFDSDSVANCWASNGVAYDDASLIHNQSWSLTNNSGQLTVTVPTMSSYDGTAQRMHLFSGNCVANPIDLSSPAAGKNAIDISLNSPMAGQLVFIFYTGANSNYAATGVNVFPLTAGHNHLTANTLDLTGTTATAIDGIGLVFRGSNGWGDYNFSGAVTIDSIAIGDAAISTATGVANATILPSDVKYYPNPSSSVINVDNMNVSSLKLMNVNGAVVKESTSSSISVEGLTSGMYFLQINNYKPVKVAVK